MKLFFLLVLFVLAVAQVMLLKADEGGALAARVNDTPISQFRLERYFTEYLNTQNRPLASIRSPSLYQRLREQALEQLIDKELLWQEAQRRNINISDTTVQAHIDQLQQSLGSPEHFSQLLTDAGFDHVSFANYTRHELAAQQVYLTSGQVAEPTPAQVRAFYQDGANTASPAQNQFSGDPVESEQGLAMAKNLLIEREQAQARQALLQRLRADSRIEYADAR